MQIQENTQVIDKVEIKKPKMYNVVFHNDDYTSMEFVVDVLINIFGQSSVRATKIMMQIHKNGKAIVGTYSYNIARTKATLTLENAKKYNYPLKVTIEEA